MKPFSAILQAVLLAALTAGIQIEEGRCDVEMDGTICLFSGEKVLAPRAKLPGLLLHYTFDDSQNLDVSGNGNHPEKGKPIIKGLEYGGEGNSAYFGGSEFLKFNADQFKSTEFSISFYFFPIQETSYSGKVECPILQKGFDSKLDGKYERSPAIYFNKLKRSLIIYFSTQDTVEYPKGEFIESNARLQYNKWSHVVLSKSGSKIKLYVNGLLDQVGVLMNFDVQNDSPFFLGNVPWLADECTLSAYIDEFKILNIETKSYQVQAEASSFLGGIEPNFLHLGCVNCPLESAKMSCITDYHLCTALELYSGVYTVAKIQGWVELSKNIWTYNQLFSNDSAATSQDKVNSGLGICCLDVKPPNAK